MSVHACDHDDDLRLLVVEGTIRESLEEDASRAAVYHRIEAGVRGDAAALLDLVGDDALVAEATAAADRIAAALSSDDLRRAVEAAEPVRLVRRLDR